MEQDAVDRVAHRRRRELPALSPWTLEILGRIERLTLLFRGAMRPQERDYGLSAGELDVLATLRLEGPPYRLTPTAITARLVITSGGLTKRLDRLEAGGLVERRPDPSDRRGWLISLTDKGRELFNRVAVVLTASGESFLVGLDTSEREALALLLRKLLLSEPFAAIDPSRRGDGPQSS